MRNPQSHTSTRRGAALVAASVGSGVLISAALWPLTPVFAGIAALIVVVVGALTGLRTRRIPPSSGLGCPCGHPTSLPHDFIMTLAGSEAAFSPCEGRGQQYSGYPLPYGTSRDCPTVGSSWRSDHAMPR